MACQLGSERGGWEGGAHGCVVFHLGVMKTFQTCIVVMGCEALNMQKSTGLVGLLQMSKLHDNVNCIAY